MIIIFALSSVLFTFVLFNIIPWTNELVDLPLVLVLVINRNNLQLKNVALLRGVDEYLHKLSCQYIHRLHPCSITVCWRSKQLLTTLISTHCSSHPLTSHISSKVQKRHKDIAKHQNSKRNGHSEQTPGLYDTWTQELKKEISWL